MAWGKKKRELQEFEASLDANRAADGSATMLLPGGDAINVVGESHYQEALEAICGGKTEDAADKACWAYLQPEPDNPFDRNAVAVYIDGRKVGYLSRDIAPDYAAFTIALWERMKGRAVCRARIMGGWRREHRRKDGTVRSTDEGHYGVVLGLAEWEHILGGELAVLTAEQLANGPEGA
jgi:hypothetical protein